MRDYRVAIEVVIRVAESEDIRQTVTELEQRLEQDYRVRSVDTQSVKEEE